MTTDLVPADHMAALDTLDAQAREVAITSMLDQARTWLAHAVESTTPAQDIANFKAFVATAAETARRLKVSKEIQVDAEVMVRRSERALGQAIRAGQERGEIAKRGDRTMPETYERNGQTVRGGVVRDPNLTSPREFFAHGEEQVAVYGVTDNVTDEQFEQALDAAQSEGNVSRANVVRKVREIAEPSYREQQDAKWDRVAELACHGWASAQIAREVGMSEQGLRRGAERYGIEFPADKHVGRTRRLDMRRIVEQTVIELESAARTTNALISVDALRAAGLDRDEVQTWVDSLTDSIKALTKARNTIKESIS